MKGKTFSQVLFLNNIFHSYLILLVSEEVTRNRKKQVGNAEGKPRYSKKRNWSFGGVYVFYKDVVRKK